MNNLYTGSSYYTYPHNGAQIDDWDDVKNANLNIEVSKYVNVQYFLNRHYVIDKLTEQLQYKYSHGSPKRWIHKAVLFVIDAD